MATVHDVAAYILRERGMTSTIALQKLVYYAQAWSLVWDGAPLFGEPIEAWRGGPVSPDLWAKHKGLPAVASIADGDADTLTESEVATVREVVRFYGVHDPQWLSELTHREAPWRDARSGLADVERSSAVISHEAIRSYYCAINAPAKALPESLARGLDLIVSVPRETVAALLSKESWPAEGLEQWLATGEGDPWGTSGG